MPDEIYELIAQGARYWFLFLMALIVWRSWRWYRKDKKQAKKRRKLLPDAGYVGEMVVVQEAGPLENGTALPVPREGTLGSTRTNDLCVPVPGVARRHLWFRFDDKRGLMVEPQGREAFTVDGVPFESRRHPLYMAHGSLLQVGDAVLRLRLFAGFECHVPRRAEMAQPVQTFQPEREQLAAQQAAMEQQWLQQQWMLQQQAYQQGYQQAMAQQNAAQQMTAQQQAAAEQMAPYSPVQPDESFAPRYTFAPQVQEPALPDGMTDADTYEAARAQGLVDDRAFMRPAGMRRPELPVREEPEYPQETQPVQTEFEHDEPFYAPVMDDEDTETPGWEELPKSAYVGHDEAERAKRRVWDHYLGGGER